MPSKKPIIHFNTDQWLIDKMKVIASENNRSLAKEMEHLCKLRIKEYEQLHGEIILEDTKEINFSNSVRQMTDSLLDMFKKLATEQKSAKDLWNEYLERMPEKKKANPDFILIKEYIDSHIDE